LADAPAVAAGQGIEGRTRWIYDLFRSMDTPALYLVHHIDAPALRDTKPSALLSTLALNPRIHPIASVRSVHAPLLWSAAEVAAPKHTHRQGRGGDVWVIHDLTTFVLYDEEITGLPRA